MAGNYDSDSPWPGGRNPFFGHVLESRATLVWHRVDYGLCAVHLDPTGVEVRFYRVITALDVPDQLVGGGTARVLNRPHWRAFRNYVAKAFGLRDDNPRLLTSTLTSRRIPSEGAEAEWHTTKPWRTG